MTFSPNEFEYLATRVDALDEDITVTGAALGKFQAPLPLAA